MKKFLIKKTQKKKLSFFTNCEEIDYKFPNCSLKSSLLNDRHLMYPIVDCYPENC